VLEDEADEDMVEVPVWELQVEDVADLELDVADAARPRQRLGPPQGVLRDVDRHEPGAGVLRRDYDGLGANAAARLKHGRAIRECRVVVEEVVQAVRLVL